uniref:Sigma-70 family RNA polymerase sigma factor n=1 Tax=Eiseniibacteriota bacterium TaxID=2212470 RepID=A0A832I4D2_UNCEI
MPDDPLPLETTVTLLQRIRAGDSAARDQLIARYLPLLRAWAHGRLPAGARGLADTDDLVQVTLLRALNRLETFEYRHEGGFLAYLRHSVLNAIRQEVRRARRKPPGEPLDDAQPDPGESVSSRVAQRETFERYEEALMELTEDQREAVMLRLEFGLSYPEIAEALGRPSANAARMLVVRGLVTLAERLADHAPGGD